MEITKRSAMVTLSIVITLAIMVAVSYLAYLAEKGYIDIVGAQAQDQLLCTAKAASTSVEQFHEERTRGPASACRQPGNPGKSVQHLPGRKPAHGTAFFS